MGVYIPKKGRCLEPFFFYFGHWKVAKKLGQLVQQRPQVFWGTRGASINVPPLRLFGTYFLATKTGGEIQEHSLERVFREKRGRAQTPHTNTVI